MAIAFNWTEFEDPYCPISQRICQECDSAVRGSCLFNRDTSADLGDFKDGTSDYNNVYWQLKTKVL